MSGLTLHLSGDDASPEQVEGADATLSLPARFEAFHEQNPHVYRILVKLAHEWVARTGRRRVGIAILWERMRWELAVQTNDEAPVLNNDYKAFFARLIMRDEPDLADLFDLRRSVADEWLTGQDAGTQAAA